MVVTAQLFQLRSYALTNGGSITAFGVALTENFDSLPTANSVWADNATIPGWYANRVPLNASTGSLNTGALYSFGAAGNGDRALGSVASGTTGTILYGVRLTNNTGGQITSLQVAYTGEQWRNGGNATKHSLTFQYQVANAGTLGNVSAGTWTTYAPLTF